MLQCCNSSNTTVALYKLLFQKEQKEHLFLANDSVNLRHKRLYTLLIIRLGYLV